MWILSPLSWMVLAAAMLALGWLAGGRGCRRVATWAFLLLSGFAILATTPWFANVLVGWLESPRPQPEFCGAEPPRVAVVLAGGIDLAPSDEEDFAALTLASRRRVEKAVAWWRERPGGQRQLVFTGGSWVRGAPADSRLMARYAERLGVDPRAIREETHSRGTWESAWNVAALEPPLPGRVVLVTSALHMPRAAYSMRQSGFETCALPADPRWLRFRLPGHLVPRSSALRKTEDALHELVGMAYYRLRGSPAASSRDAP